MLCFYRISGSEGIDVNKTSESKESAICHHNYFSDNGCKFQTEVCKGCHDVLTTLFGVDYCYVIERISKSEAVNRYIIKRISKSKPVNVLQNVDLIEKSVTL